MSSGDGDGIRPLSPTLSAAARADVPVDALLPADSPRTGGLDQEYVETLVALAEELPPIVVHRPTGRVVDGTHRLAAARARGDRTIGAYLLDVPEHSLFAVAVSLNISHGKPLTHGDRLAAAARILRENPALSDRYVASVTALSPRTVSRVRRSTAEVAHLNTRVGLDGKRRPAGTAAVAGRRQRAGELLLERPDASLREIARAAGISLGTAHDVKKRVLLGRDPVPRGRGAAAARSEHAAEHRVPAQRRPSRSDGGPSLRESAELLERLRKDPALRLSQSGRFLLRCFAVHDVDSSVWTRLATTVPPHCADSVSRLARECADMWSRFADRVDREAGTARQQRSHTSA
ncbi:ParB N-terminal domain-containing protein [Streptomyces sp. TRM49041]|uniref:ParB N-terminal domain-containing protein n=1 Tax=Streptomyces sp. TRM49041 TaxID=2603216 RepID=UPI0011EC6FAE|nr:ParB N-terminal domain-containing protein [Streptomyces sp. TRM49041]